MRKREREREWQEREKGTNRQRGETDRHQETNTEERGRQTERLMLHKVHMIDKQNQIEVNMATYKGIYEGVKSVESFCRLY